MFKFLREIIYVVMIFCLLTSVSSAAGKWYAGGTLTKASIAQWKAATNTNRLATAADWAINAPSVKRKVVKSGNMNTLRPYAQGLVNCVNIAVTDLSSSKHRVSEIAVSCIVLLGWN